jgi:signal transduction histidine kinase/CheY-like chemotaxis protein
MSVSGGLNSRVLVIDDEESVRDSFSTVLAPHVQENDDIQEAANVLFGDAPPPRKNPASLSFHVDVAPNGRDGLWMVEAALARKEPYAAIFCDMRMPGWDGLETVERIRKLDQRAQIIFVTAYSDHSIETIAERAGADVGYFVKPFLTEEVKQLATKVVLEWNKARELEELMQTITSLSGEEKDMDRLLKHLLALICGWLDTESAALLRLLPDRRVDYKLGIGALSDATKAKALVEDIAAKACEGDVVQLPEGATLLPIQEFGLAIALAGKTRMTHDRRFLLRAFLEHASLAIRNSELRARMLEQERMAAVGQALSYVVHDLRCPLGAAQMLVSMLRKPGGSRLSQGEIVERIAQNLDRALSMAEDTLAWARGQWRVAPRDVELGAALAGTLETCQAELEGRRVALRVEIPTGLVANVDPELVGRVVWNLTKNAAAALSGVSTPQVSVGAAEVAGGTELFVADNGPGLSPEIAAWLGQPGASAVPRTNGGLGLCIVRQIVEAHGGRITVDAGGEGTTLRMFFPHRSG